MPEKLKAMFVHAHPDDESSKGAATMARYVDEGIEVLVVTCTGGERGSVLNEKMDRPEVWENITSIRAAEMATAREVLGVRQSWLGFTDSGLPEGWTRDSDVELPEDSFYRVPTDKAAAPLVELIRDFKPQVMVTYDEDGGYPHPDHIKTHEISVAAFEAAGDPEAYPDRGEPWQPSKLYYDVAFTVDKLRALHNAMLDAGLESPYANWIERRSKMPDKSARITTKVECAQHFAVRDEALKAHATQVDPDGFWFAVPLDLQQKTWPWETYQLVKSTVETDQPENDLFAGLR
ncbi:mycothiol conjugate amidase Mca [Haloglycomyces albus]|uniref:mycothiol conjugate amidase Mca n=1 Tax=Haloglycomyces albus TaxID=526067 RepID=UPI00046CF473|nr:mycothiol conjugate amidase Mca [Haloglycomyces albus]